jgi:hypothetical protein
MQLLANQITLGPAKILSQRPGAVPVGADLLVAKVSRCVLYIMGRAIVIAVILQSDPSIKMYMGLRAGKQLNQEHTHIQ